MQERVDEFLEHYPERKMNRWKLASVYSMCGIKRKVVRKTAANPNRYAPGVVADHLALVQARLADLNARGYEIYQVDESVFSA